MAFYLRTIVVFGLIVSSAVSAWIAGKPGQSELGLSPDRFEHDFGRVAQRASPETTFLLQNRSGNPITIVSHAADCACSQTVLDRTRLEPEDVAKLSTKLTVGESRGNVFAQILIIFQEDGDPELSRLFLKLRADVKSDYEVSPREVISFESGKKSERHIEVIDAAAKSRHSPLRGGGVALN